MKLRKIALAGAFLASAFCGPLYAQDVTLRFQHFLPAAAAMPSQFMAPWAEKVAKESGGRIKIDLYPSMQLGGRASALYDQIRDGVIDGGMVIPGYSPGRFPGVETIDLPFITSATAENASKALFEFYEQYLTEEFNEIKILAIWVHGPGAFHTKGTTIKSVADMNGLKLRTPTRVTAETLTALGAVPIGMPVPQLPEAISKGVVDGTVLPFEVVPPLRMQELATAHTIVGGDRALYSAAFIWGMNRNAYDRLPDDLKAVIDANSGVATSAWAGSVTNDADKVGLDAVKEVGNELVTLSDDVVAEMKVLTQPVIDGWIAEMADKGYPAADMVQTARELMAKYDQ